MQEATIMGPGEAVDKVMQRQIREYMSSCLLGIFTDYEIVKVLSWGSERICNA